MSKRKHQVEEPIEAMEPVVDDETVTEEVNVIAHVVNCEKLNVRKEPKKNAEIICAIKEGTEVTIDHTESTIDFYKVCLISGVQGFCMKEFIAI